LAPRYSAILAVNPSSPGKLAILAQPTRVAELFIVSPLDPLTILVMRNELIGITEIFVAKDDDVRQPLDGSL
jgi:hypothetical protein